MSATTDPLWFCPSCFASEETGSWGHTVIGGHCLNCGAGGAIQLVRWAVDEIRRSASWVGRRYYPSDEDRQLEAERKALLALVTTFPGREAVPAFGFNEAGERIPKEGQWEVRQMVSKDRCHMTWVVASSAEEAIERTRYSLPYVPEPHAEVTRE